MEINKSNSILNSVKEIILNSALELIKFEGDYLINDPIMKTTIKISFKLVKYNQNYKVKGAVNLYEFTCFTSEKVKYPHQEKRYYNYNLIEQSS